MPSGACSDYARGQRFNTFMIHHVHETVYLFIFLDDEQSADLTRTLATPDSDNRAYFYVPNDYSTDDASEGCEYLIHLPQEPSNRPFEWLQKAGRLSGRFRIWTVSGPRQGTYSVNLRPIEEFER